MCAGSQGPTNPVRLLTIVLKTIARLYFESLDIRTHMCGHSLCC